MSAALMISTHAFIHTFSIINFSLTGLKKLTKKYKVERATTFCRAISTSQKIDLHHELIKNLAGMSNIQITAVQGCCLAVSGSNTPQRPCYEKSAPIFLLTNKSRDQRDRGTVDGLPMKEVLLGRTSQQRVNP